MPDNYYETEESQYCCETCPDEEKTFLSSSSSSSSSSSLPTDRARHRSSKYKKEDSEEVGQEEEEVVVVEEEEEEGVKFQENFQTDKDKEDMTDNRITSYASAKPFSLEEKIVSKDHDDEESEEVVARPTKRSVDTQIHNLVLQTLRMGFEYMTSPVFFEKNAQDEDRHEDGDEDDDDDNDDDDEDGDNNDEKIEEEKNERCDPLKDESSRLAEATSSTEAKNSKEEATTTVSLPLISPEIPSTPSDSNKMQVPSPPARANRNKNNKVPKDQELDKSKEQKLEDSVDDSCKANDTSLSTVQGIDLSTSEEYPEELNPFKSEDEEENGKSHYQTALDDLSRNISKVSTNPFDESDEEENVEEDKKDERDEREIPLSPSKGTVLPAKRRLTAPQISLNPFSSDEEEENESDTEIKRLATDTVVPIPKPRTITNTFELRITRKTSDLNRRSVYASNSSITSSESTSTTSGGTYRKKKQAPLPPMAKELFPSTGCRSVSPRTTMPRIRKTKPAPPPPLPSAAVPTPPTQPSLLPSSTPNISVDARPLTFEESPIISNPDNNVVESRVHNMWEDQKNNKDETNRNRQSLTSSSVSCGESPSSFQSYPDKSVQGKWKRKKGPAPPRPIPHRRKIKVMSMKDVKLELDEIELQQQGLERQGVRLEQLIRDKCETGSRVDESTLSLDVEELILELFSLVNEKNELFRRQAELMLLRRQQRLEEEHADVEYQIRWLMCQPEATKTDFDKQREEALIQRLVEIVERRNEIVECLEMDRKRAVEEDKSIHKHMGLFAARNKNDAANSNNDSSNFIKSKKSKLKEKIKEKKLKKLSKKDADKDVDETEVKLKRHNKRKWF